jgi:heme exporter protein A
MLTVNHLEIQREGRSIHAPLSFTLKKGEALWLKGPNGCGKSTLLKAILGWLPHEGVVLAPDHRITYLGHHTGLPLHLSVWDHCALHPAIPSFDEKTCQAVLAALGLESLIHRRIATLSAGQKQRLALVPVMLSGASLWLLDEPFNALDVNSTLKVKSLLKGYLQEGVAMIVVSHDDLSDWATQVLDMGVPDVTV